MNQNYALHKRFIKDVDRIVGRDENLEKVIIYAINYLSLRQVHSDEISNHDLMEVARKVSFIDLDLPDLYREMIKDLTNQEFIFRIKRVKYVRNTRDTVAIVSSPLLKRIGKELMSTTITSSVALMDDSIEPSDTQVSSEANPSEESSENPEENENFNTLEYLNQIWDDSDLRLKWLLRNMKYTNRKYGYSQENGYTPEEISEATGKNVLTVKHYVREYLRAK
jgi:hypothetical protein